MHRLGPHKACCDTSVEHTGVLNIRGQDLAHTL